MSDYRQLWSPPDLVQPEEGYRYTTDAFLLAAFAARQGKHIDARHWCDLGTGSGIIAYELTHKLGGQGTAVERQQSLLHYARQNLRNHPVSLIEGDLRNIPWPPASLDLVVTNPPFYEVGKGHISRHPMRAEARHTFHGDVRDFAKTMRPALTEKGLFCFVFPYDLHHRILADLHKANWHIHANLTLHSFEGREPKLICLALGATEPKEVRKSDLVIYQAHREFTDAMQHYLLGQ